MKLLICVGLALLPAGFSQSQPTAVIVDAVANSASYWRAGQNQAGIAQGSLFVILGSNLGPSELAQALFPLSDQLGGSSVRIQVGSTVVQALMVYTVSRQIGAVLPSQTPLGAGTLVVTYDGQSSASVPITVAASAIGVYTLNQGGTGSGAVTTPDYQVIGPSFAANPGETLIAWATGIGAAAGNEAAAPLAGDLGGVEVFVGNNPAVVHYAGRSGCCAGVDQVAFDVPTGVSGCFVPLAIRAHGSTGNFTSLAITPQGRQCRDTIGLPQSALAKAAAGEDLRFGAIGLGLQSQLNTFSYRIDRRIPVHEFGAISWISSFESMLSLASRSPKTRTPTRKAVRDALRSYRNARRQGERPRFDRAQIEAALASAGPIVLVADFGIVHKVAAALSYITSTFSAVGSCSVGVCVTADCGFPAVMPRQHGAVLDAGRSLTVSGPAGSASASKLRGGDYRAILPLAATSSGLAPGTYTVTGLGGADVGAFSASLALPATLHWTNQPQITRVNRQASLTITWNTDAGPGHVLVGGTSSYPATGTSGIFLCSEERSKGSFTIPSFVLSALPVPSAAGSNTAPGRGYIFLASHPLDNSFTAPGLDVGFFRDISIESKPVSYQ
ncbi:MAG TPA: hypothetical protein VKT49_16425 [Bryobacteraceae bacterium]|nr:hypothetical protein [Bryobacteraceae bacterium]